MAYKTKILILDNSIKLFILFVLCIPVASHAPCNLVIVIESFVFFITRCNDKDSFLWVLRSRHISYLRYLHHSVSTSEPDNVSCLLILDIHLRDAILRTDRPALPLFIMRIIFAKSIFTGNPFHNISSTKPFMPSIFKCFFR